jgi:GNAT superfamily N-acetyltransferase
MPRLAVANPRQVEQVYRESYDLWGAGLSRRDYLALWNELSRTDWAAKHARFHVWVDEDDRVLSSLKLYRPWIRFAGRTARSAVLGAVFTPRAHRRRGHASALLRAVLEDSRRWSAPLVLLFSDIGTEFYRALGFRSLPAEEQWGTLSGRTVRSSPPWSLRTMCEDDLGTAREAHEQSSSGRALAVIRDEDHWRFLWARSQGFFSRLRNPTVKHRCQVATSRGRVIGYLIAVEGRGEWNVREVGAVDGDPATMAGILRLGAAQAHASGLRRFYGWLPPEVTACLTGWSIRSRARRGALPMILPLGTGGEGAALDSPSAAFLPYQDQF